MQIKPYNLNLKAMSKLVFLPQEDVERVILKNLTYDWEKAQLQVDMSGVIDMIRDININHTKPKFTEVKCKMLVPQFWVTQTQNTDAGPQKLTTLDITIK